jgi:hypothetical protein
MLSSGMLRRVALLRTDVSEELSVSTIKVKRIGELQIRYISSSVRQLLVRSNVFPSSPILLTLRMEATRSSET